MHTISKIFIAFILGIIFTIPAYSQLDYYAGQNRSGFRLGIGGGVSILQTHYTKNSPQPVLVTNVDYDFNPYLSMGIEYQYGKLLGEDTKNRIYFKKSDITYGAANFNVRVSVGEFVDYTTTTLLGDAIKRFYVGTGIGVIDETIILTPTNSPFLSAPEAYQGQQAPTTFKSSPYTVVPFNFGTNIDLRGLFGMSDKFEINPNYQFTFVNSYFLDGFKTNVNSHLKGFYDMATVSLKYKF